MEQNLGRLEAQFFACVQMRKLRTVRSGYLTACMQNGPQVWIEGRGRETALAVVINTSRRHA
jgi:hypothetical protein